MFTVFAGIYYWFPKMTGRMYNERLGQLHFWLTFIAFNLTFFPMHYIGLQGMPRRVADYASRFADFNLFISIASFGLGASTVIFLYNMIHSWKYGEKADANPWHAMTLEWQVSSPPPTFNFDEIPQVVGSPYEYGVVGGLLAQRIEQGRRGSCFVCNHEDVAHRSGVSDRPRGRAPARSRRGGSHGGRRGRRTRTGRRRPAGSRRS